jgi:hypothetical protein
MVLKLIAVTHDQTSRLVPWNRMKLFRYKNSLVLTTKVIYIYHRQFFSSLQPQLARLQIHANVSAQFFSRLFIPAFSFYSSSLSSPFLLGEWFDNDERANVVGFAY